MMATVFEIKRFAVHDGDGIRTTVFFKGCPLRCVWCHNPEGLIKGTQDAFYAHKCIGCGTCQHADFDIADCPVEARVRYGKEMSVDMLLPLLLEDRDFYESSGGGVTLSGGECLLEAEFCAALLGRLKEHGIHTAVDTCGYVTRGALDLVIPYTDIFLYDLKAYDADVHIRCTGRSNESILENLLYLDRMEQDIEIRIPYVPHYNDTEMEKLAHFLAPLRHIKGIRVLPYHNYAGSKYAALQMQNTMPTVLPTERELAEARELFARITHFAVIE